MGIIITSLCGHYYSKASYKLQAKKLESYGFEVLRSKEGEDKKIWEMWYLPGPWSAKGDLKKAVEEDPVWKEEKKIDKAIGFLCRHVEFGSLEVSTQRAAMPAPGAED